ncbi:MAG TPA: outer membrane beta-barrel family protein, partial [Sphingomicrobium sp.]|nr:outer membrane beta-barrel family protein [Sphingomicrobium sp.]
GAEAEASAKVTYELDPKTSLSAKILGAAVRDVGTNDARFAGLTPSFTSFLEHQRSINSISVLISELTFDHKGKQEGETLSGSLHVFGNPEDHEANTADFSNGGALSIDTHKRLLFANGQVDWQHPMGKGEILSVGGSWDYARLSEQYQFTSVQTGGSLGSDASDQFRGIDNKFAAYATFQQPIGKWTLMPGLRVEHDARHISSPGHPDIDIARTDVFPTLHIERPLTKKLDLTLSYSKRIDRPPVDWLRPFRQVESVLTIAEGNPRLRDQSTDAYELNLHYHRNKVDAGVIFYDRETTGLWSSAYSVVNGVNIYTWVNAGHRSDRGAEFDVGMPIIRHVKANASLNLFDERAPIDTTAGAAVQETFRFSTNATLEWDGPGQGKIPGDVAQLQWIYNSPWRQFQFRYFTWNWLSFAYTHSFSPTLSLTATTNYSSANRHRLLAPLVQEYFTQRSPLEFKLKLLKSFGKP